MSRSAGAKAERTSPTGLIVMMAMWLAVGLLPIGFSVGDVRLAFGLTGEPGRATVELCVETGGGKGSGTDCRGTFRPDAPGAAPVGNVHLPPESDEGETFTARLRPDGEHAVPTGLKGRLASLALPALGLFFLLPMPIALRYLISDRRAGRVSLYALVASMAGAAVLCITGLVASGL
ncbi:hypothetical protein [Spirillospora albida]|uniref:hypothetical protein n=1 Tax=Spirillospora albida TaxID=58123 RepID=UPI0004BEB112|nr:hypothetical protein [Spirillospora albida]